MEIRLNKLISDSGLCSRREADKFIESGRVTVNGVLPESGQKVTEHDVVVLDDIRIQMNKRATEHSRTGAGKTQELIFGGEEKLERNKPTAQSTVKPTIKSAAKPATQPTSKPAAKSATASTEKKEGPKPASSKGPREGKYVKYNKYAAARKAAKSGDNKESGDKPNTKDVKKRLSDPDALREAMQPKFGKSLSRSAVAQRMASSPKSAALRKTSKNNPLNKAKHAGGRNKSKGI